MTLQAGNYEYPFEYTMPGDAAESVEGIPEASISYRLKATVGRGKFAYDLHSYKHLRVIRTLEAGALEFHHAMSVENIWPNKIDYSIVVPQKAVAFGGRVNLEMRLTPLLKGLELGKITVCLLEIRETCIQSFSGYSMREHKVEREVERWDIEADRETCWHDTIEDTGQEGWLITRPLNLPRRLRQCIQDVNIHGIKVRHKLKLTIGLKNPDGHISEVCLTLTSPAVSDALLTQPCSSVPLYPSPSSSRPTCPSTSKAASSTPRWPARPTTRTAWPLPATATTLSTSCTTTI